MLSGGVYVSTTFAHKTVKHSQSTRIFGDIVNCHLRHHLLSPNGRLGRINDGFLIIQFFISPVPDYCIICFYSYAMRVQLLCTSCSMAMHSLFNSYELSILRFMTEYLKGLTISQPIQRAGSVLKYTEFIDH